MRFIHGCITSLLLIFVVIPFQLTIGKFWQPRDRGLWGWLGRYFNEYLPKP
jgi:hypothetical protein